ncbi:PAS domain-containing methyl-accepting chemotaxis protein [Marinomonas sp.]|nr:PAS domain-containing methyl-accepting chemotaxis protein [Marinomonas sp.]MDB4837612.1 PAS domain-containing methyl-accepting chemotaxis protein [Marinomonas sp.]
MGLFFKKKNIEVVPSQEQLEASKSHYILESLKGSVAFIEFSPNGTILNANENFLEIVGYSIEEIKGKHHSIFCDKKHIRTPEYSRFWRKLSSGESIKDRFLRFTKNNRPVWLEASYNAVKDDDGNISSVVKFATDITEFVTKSNIQNGVLNAIDTSTSIIAFELDGTIIEANHNFLQATGYTLSDVQGQHHKIFCAPELVNSNAYKDFWRKLNRGEYVKGLFERRDADGNVVWLEASYNPIADKSGKLIRIIKFASDVSDRVKNINNASDAVHSTAAETEQVSEQGKEVISKSVSIMDEISKTVEIVAKDISDINEQSDKINNIVNTISDIADQTNLLALNAAIEAARAGDLGRGFAVVADEVRQLAARTSASTAEISDVVKTNVTLSSVLSKNIVNTQKKARSGSELIYQVDGIFMEINQGMKSVGAAVDRL